MKRMKSILGVWILGMWSLGSLVAQNCIPVEVAFHWQGLATQPALLTFSVVNEGNVVVPVVTLPFVSGPQELNQTLCLEPGCYQVNVGSNVPLNGELLDVAFSGEGVEVAWLTDGNWEWAWTVCVEGVATDCPDAIDFAQGTGCEWAFEIGGFVPGESVEWNFSDGTEVLGGHFVQHTFPGNGGYWVTASYTSSLCPEPVILATEVLVTGCGGECPLELNWTSTDGIMHVFTATGAPEGAVYTWWVDGVFIEEGQSGVIELGFDFNPYWTVCVAYETPDCAAETCAQNLPVSCGFEVATEEVAPGVWVLTALGPNGGVWDGPVEWSLGNGEEASGNPVAWTWETPGVYTVCAQAPASPACPDGPFDCVEVETSGSECEEVQLVLSPTGAVVTGFGLTLTLAPDWLGLPIGGWEWAENWECPAGWSGDTIEICLPSVCYGVDLSVPGWVWESLGGLTAQLGEAGPLLWNAVQGAGQTYSQNPACATSTPSVAAPRPGLHAAPVPARDEVTVSYDFAGVADWQVRTSTGALQAAGRSAAPFTLDVRAWSPGWYILHLQTPQGPSTKKLLVLRD